MYVRQCGESDQALLFNTHPPLPPWGAFMSDAGKWGHNPCQKLHFIPLYMGRAVKQNIPQKPPRHPLKMTASMRSLTR